MIRCNTGAAALLSLATLSMQPTAFAQAIERVQGSDAALDCEAITAVAGLCAAALGRRV